MARKCRDERIILPQPSRYWRMLVGALILVQIFVLLWYFAFSGAQAALLVCSVAAGIWAMRLPCDISELSLQDKGLAEICYRGQKQPAQLCAGSLLMRGWACLSWRLENGRCVQQILLPDSLSADDWRFVYVWATLWQKK